MVPALLWAPNKSCQMVTRMERKATSFVISLNPVVSSHSIPEQQGSSYCSHCTTVLLLCPTLGRLRLMSNIKGIDPWMQNRSKASANAHALDEHRAGLAAVCQPRGCSLRQKHQIAREGNVRQAGDREAASAAARTAAE